MPDTATLTVVAVVALAVVAVVLRKVQQNNRLNAMMKKRQANATVVSRAEYVDGANSIPVAMALTPSTIYYENPDLEASFDLDRIEEIEYAGELATGRGVENGKQVLRLRSHGATFEFVMAAADEKKWEQVLPARRLGQQPANVVPPSNTSQPAHAAV